MPPLTKANVAETTNWVGNATEHNVATTAKSLNPNRESQPHIAKEEDEKPPDQA